MRLTRFVISTTVFFSLSTTCGPTAEAAPCTTPKGAREKFELAKFLRTETENHYNDLVFVFMDRDGKYDSDEAVHLTLDPKKSTAEIPDAVFKKAAKKGVFVHVFHRSSVSAYIIPIAANKMKSEFNPKVHCAGSDVASRRIAPPPANDVGCDAIDISKFVAGTILYDQSANSCSTFGALSGKLTAGEIKKGSKEEDELKVAITSFNNTFGTDNKLGDFTGNRKPAFSKITYAPGKTQDVGEPKSTPKTKSSAGGGG